MTKICHLSKNILEIQGSMTAFQLYSEKNSSILCKKEKNREHSSSEVLTDDDMIKFYKSLLKQNVRMASMRQKYQRFKNIVKNTHIKFESGKISLSLYDSWVNRLYKIEQYFLRECPNMEDL